MKGKNIGDLLNAQASPGAWFEGGFDLTVTNPNGTTGCAREPAAHGRRLRRPRPTTSRITSRSSTTPRRRTRSTLGRAAPTAIGNTSRTTARRPTPPTTSTTATTSSTRCKAGNFPAVCYLKAPAYQDGHPATPTRSTSRPSSCRSCTPLSESGVGLARRSCSRTTTRTAGTTIRRRRSSILRPATRRRAQRRRPVHHGAQQGGRPVDHAAARSSDGTPARRGDAGTALACRSWSSRPGRRRTTSITR